jgi:hypothetical protein
MVLDGYIEEQFRLLDSFLHSSASSGSASASSQSTQPAPSAEPFTRLMCDTVLSRSV